MIEINFRYLGKDSLIKCYESELIEDVCEKFAKDNALDLDNLYFFYKGEKINFHLGLFVEQQYSLKNNSSSNETKRMDIDIYEESPFYMKFFYNGTSRPLKIDRNEKLREAFKRYSKKYCIDLKKVYFFYNTKIYYFNKLDEIKINEIINSTDQTEKAMSIFVYDDDTISKYSEKNNIDNKISIEDENFDTSLIIENDDKEAPFIIKFFYKGPPCILNVKENEKMSDIFFRYSEKVAIDLTRVRFFYNKKYYAYDKIGDKILKEIISDKDKIDKILSITVSEFEKNLNKNQNIIEDNNTDLSLKEDNELEENLLDKATIKLNKMATKKSFYTNNFIILIIQHVLILLFYFLGFFYEMNESILNPYINIASIILQISICIFFIIFFFLNRLYENKNGYYMIIFLVFYPFIVIYYSFLLSLNIDYKCIIIGLLFCFIEILTMGFNLLIIKNYEIKNFGLSAIVFSKVGLILFSVLWIKSFYPIIYISLFWLYTNAHYTFWLFISIKICKLDESFYSIIIHNYTIFLGLAYCIKVGINNIGNIIRVSLVDAKKSFYLKIFLILIIQHFIIALLSFLGFYFGINQIFLNKYIIISHIILQIIILIIFIFNKMLYESPQKRYMYIFHILYPFRAILLFFLLSQHFDYKCIMIGLFFILIEILSLGFNIISLDNYKLLYFGISSSLFSFIALILFSSLWVKDLFPIIYISLFWIQTNAYYLFWIFLTSKIELNELNNYFYSALIFDYGTIMGLTYIIKNGLQYIIINIKERIRLLNEQESYTNDKRLYILESFLILFFQHMSVVLISFIGFFTGFYEIFANSTTNIIFLVFQILVVIFLAIFLANKECFENKNGSYMIILLIIYPIFIIYYSFLISQSIDYKYTIIGLSFILIEISIPIICIFYYNDYHLLIYAINSTIFSLVSFIIFSVLWIKDILPIIYTGLFWIAIDAYYILYVFLLTNILNGYGYIFSVITFNYYIYFLLAFVAKYIGIGFGYLIQYIGKGIKIILEDIKKRKEEGNASSEVFKLFFIFFIQYTIITVVVWIGIASGIERYLKEGTTFMILMICNSIINLFLCIIFVYFVHYEKKGVGFCFYKYFYVPMMILYYFLFSTFIESDYILCFLFILFFELLFLVIFIFYFKIENFIIINAIGVIINTITILFFHFLWVQDGIVTRNISLITLSVDIYILVLGLVLFHFINDKNDKNYIEDFTNIAFNYGLFCLVFALAIALLALGIAIAIGTIGLICWICSCICENGCK